MQTNANDITKTDNSIKKKLKATSSDGNVDEKIFRSLEDLITFIGSHFPHFWYTVFPICFVVGTTYFIVSVVSGMTTLNHIAKRDDSPVFYYSTCDFSQSEDRYEIERHVHFMNMHIPSWDVTIIINTVLAVLLVTISPRKIMLTCLITIVALLFSIAFFQKYKHLKIFMYHTLMDILRLVSTITMVESIPKYHRIVSMVLVRISMSTGRVLGTMAVRTVLDLHMDASMLFEFFALIVIADIYITYYTFRDSLSYLLAMNKTDKLQEELSYIFKKSKINLPEDVVIDYLAFENFEPNSTPKEVMGRMMKSIKILREILISGCICGCLTSVNSYVQSEVHNHKINFFFEQALFGSSSYSFSAILIVLFSFTLPNKRILPIIIIVPLLFILVTIIYIFEFAQYFDLCTLSFTVPDHLIHVFSVLTVTASSITCVIKIYITLHLIEYVPTLARIPAFAFINFIQYSFEGNVQSFLAQKSLGGIGALFLVSLVSMLLFLVTPRKKIDMNVFFSELHSDTGRRLPPPPDFEGKVKTN